MNEYMVLWRFQNDARIYDDPQKQLQYERIQLRILVRHRLKGKWRDFKRRVIDQTPVVADFYRHAFLAAKRGIYDTVPKIVRTPIPPGEKPRSSDRGSPSAP